MKFKNNLSVLLVGAIFFVLILGCGSSRTCTGELTINGKTHRGIDKDAEQAKLNTCSKYCIEGNSEFDAMYRIWLDSPKSKNVPDRNNKWAAAAEDKGLKDFVEKCQQKCLQADREGKQKIDVKCQ